MGERLANAAVSAIVSLVVSGAFLVYRYGAAEVWRACLALLTAAGVRHG